MLKTLSLTVLPILAGYLLPKVDYIESLFYSPFVTQGILQVLLSSVLLLCFLIPYRHRLRNPKNKIASKIKAPAEGKLPLEAVKILKVLADYGESSAGYIIGLTLIASPVKLDYWLEELENKKFIGCRAYYTGDETIYFLAQNGREYLIKNNLL